MRKLFTISFTLLLLSILTLSVFAHRGGTDSNGGHYDRISGDYHYHHGYSAHEHVDGVCPYDYHDNRDTNDYDYDVTTTTEIETQEYHDNNDYDSNSFSDIILKIELFLSDVWFFIKLIAFSLMFAITPSLIIPFVLGALYAKIAKKDMPDKVFYSFIVITYIISAILIFIGLLSAQ